MPIYEITVDVGSSVSLKRKHRTVKRKFTIGALNKTKAIEVLRKEALRYSSGIRSYKILDVKKIKWRN